MEKSFKNMGGLYIGHLYWIIQRKTGRKNGINVRCSTEGARKSVQLHNIGSMCVTALPTQISPSLVSFTIGKEILPNLNSFIGFFPPK